MNSKNIRRKVVLLLVGLITFGISSWTLQKNFYFLFDDIAWLREVKFNFDVKDFFTLFPTSRYNDRPLRTFFFWCIYQIFGMNYTAYYLIILICHVVNTYLVYVLATKVFTVCDIEEDCFWRSVFVSVWFALYPKNLLAVFWIAGAANDLLCAFFSLLVMFFYVEFIQNRRKWWTVLLSFIFYVCAMRSKEAAICLPIIIVLFEVYLYIYNNRKKISDFIGCIPLCIYMIAYLVCIFCLPATLTTDGPYKQDFSVHTIINVLFNYVRLYFAWDDGNLSYDINNCYTKVGNIGIVFIFILIVVIISRVVRKEKTKENIGYIMLFLMVGLSVAPLLVLPNVQHLLYLYFPAIFLSFLFGCALYDAALKLFDYKSTRCIATLLLMISLCLLNNTGGAKRIRDNFLLWGQEAKSAVEDIYEIDKLPSDTHVYIGGADKGANVFNYAPGYIINIIYNDETLIPELKTETTQYEIPYVVWEYEAGHVLETERVLE